MSEPLVSCLCVTRPERAWCLPLAIECFRQQTYQNRELVVITTGELSESFVKLLDAPDIRHVHSARKLTLGGKRNLACSEARGELLCSWDDDDYHAPNRLSWLVRALDSADVAGCQRMVFHDLLSGRWWMYRYTGRRPYVMAAAMVFRRKVWERSPYPETSKGEDTKFCFVACRDNRVAVVAQAEQLYVAFRHGGNTEHRNTFGPPKFIPLVSGIPIIDVCTVARYVAALSDRF